MPEQLNLLETDRETAKRWFAHIRALLTLAIEKRTEQKETEA